MNGKDKENQIAMTLARRAYLYGMFHVVFGGGVNEASATQLFGGHAHDALAWLTDQVAGDEEFSQKSIGLSLRTMEECAEEAAACVDEHGEECAAAKAAIAMKEDFPKLFQVPGDSHVRPWESPYTNTDGMLFRGSTLDVRSFYHRAGFKLQTEQHFPDDHISAMMDYMVRMSQRAYDAYADGCDGAAADVLCEQSDFLRKHVLTWVDAFADEVIRKDIRAYYAAFAGAMAVFAHVDAAHVEKLAAELSAE